MALMALAFTLVNRREGNLGMQLFIGILIGLSFHFSTACWAIWACCTTGGRRRWRLCLR